MASAYFSKPSHRQGGVEAGVGVWLILFDVDGTLLRCGPQVRSIFSGALLEVFGTTGDLDSYQFAGRTDDGIVFDLMTGAGLAERRVAELLPGFREVYLGRLERDLDRAGMEILPGVEPLLERLAGRDEVLLGLLTGNWEPGARSKLARFDLNRFFSFGAFGDGCRSRHQLPPLALERARQHPGWQGVSPERTMIVGDSVLDVSCALAHGLDSLAVATGFTAAADLERAGARWVIEDLRQVASCHPVFA
jgi:phosphoglycolate phosphatase-like HAD superfamily hydrolase